MLIADPLVEGSSASSTDGELWRAENSFLGMRGTQLPMRSSRAENSLLRVRGNSHAPKRAARSQVTLYGEGSNASSTRKESDLSQSSEERRTHSSE